jgi:anti-repressor protein
MELIENGLIPIYQGENDDRLVDARELHSFMEVTSKFADWIKNRIDDCGLVENLDYVVISKNLETRSGGTVRKEYGLTLDSAKHLSMIERNDQGKQARQYFIEVEKRSKKPVAALTNKELAQMVIAEAERAEALSAIVQRQTKQIASSMPKIEVYDQFMAAESATSIGVFAKMVGWGQNKLFDFLRNSKILFKKGFDNVPYQDYLERGYFVVKTTPIKMGERVETRAVTLVTPKGQEWIYRKLKAVEETLP